MVSPDSVELSDTAPRSHAVIPVKISNRLLDANRWLRASGDAGRFGPAGAIGSVTNGWFPGAGEPFDAPEETGSRAGFLKISWVGQDADGSRAASAAPTGPKPPTSPAAPMFESRCGRVQRLARSSRRGVGLPGDGAWVAGSRTIVQHPSASVELLERIQFRMPLNLFHGHQSSTGPCPSRKADRPTTCQQATPLRASPNKRPGESDQACGNPFRRVSYRTIR